MTFDYEKLDLPNGIRLRAVKIPQSPTVTFAVLVGTGSRQETPALSGLAHFIEHTVFKGTPSLPSSQQVSDAIESIGGVHNAFTSFEYTGYYAKASSGRLPQLTKVISDVFLNPLFPRKDLDIERGNVIEEINMYEDNPLQKVIRDFLRFTFSGHALGQSVLGTRENLQRFSQSDLTGFINKFYDPRRIIVIAAGDFGPQEFFSLTEGIFGSVSLSGQVQLNPYTVTQQLPAIHILNKKLDQAHLVLGFRSFGLDDPREETLEVLNEILGGPASLSSRLFHKIRDELGLAYYVGSDTQSYKETGIWLARAGVRIDKTREAVAAILGEYKKLATAKVLDQELARAKEHLKGKLSFELETSDGVMEYYGLTELTEAGFKTPQEKIAKIEAVTAEEVQKLASELVDKNKLTVAVLGPFDETVEKEKILGLIGQ